MTTISFSMFFVSGWWEGGGFTLEDVVGMEGGGIGLFEGSRL